MVIIYNKVVITNSLPKPIDPFIAINTHDFVLFKILLQINGNENQLWSFV